MQEMNWLESHIGAIDDAVKVINQFSWEISITQSDTRWYVSTGSQEKHVIFSADTRDAVDSFLYGMALALVGIPSPLFEKLVEDVAEWKANL
jgi:hypothetical protein